MNQHFQIGVENRDYHYLSQSEIAGAKRILDICPFFVGKSTED